MMTDVCFETDLYGKSFSSLTCCLCAIFSSAGMEKEKQCTSRWEDLVYFGEVSGLVRLAPCVMSILCYNENELSADLILC